MADAHTINTLSRMRISSSKRRRKGQKEKWGRAINKFIRTG